MRQGNWQKKEPGENSDTGASIEEDRLIFCSRDPILHPLTHESRSTVWGKVIGEEHRARGSGGAPPVFCRCIPGGEGVSEHLNFDEEL